MNIVDIVRQKHLGAIEEGLVTFVQHSVQTGIEIGEWNIEGVTKPTNAELLAEAATYEHAHNIHVLNTEFKVALKNHLDGVAMQRNYDDEIKIMTYVDSGNTSWAAEAQAYSDWRDAVWLYALEQLALFESGDRDIVTVDEFINELPVITWPA